MCVGFGVERIKGTKGTVVPGKTFCSSLQTKVYAFGVLGFFGRPEGQRGDCILYIYVCVCVRVYIPGFELLGIAVSLIHPPMPMLEFVNLWNPFFFVERGKWNRN